MTDSDLIRVSKEGSARTVSFSRNHLNDIHTARQIAEHLSELIGGEKPPGGHDSRLNLDFGNIDRISSAGLNELIGINSRARSHGIRLVLLDVQESVRDVFTHTRLERMFEFGSTSVNA
jgi:anti-anti-sigma factor